MRFVMSIPYDKGTPLRFQRPACNPEIPAATRRNRLAQLARSFSSMSGVSLGEQYLKIKLVLSTWSFQSFQLTEWNGSVYYIFRTIARIILLAFEENLTRFSKSFWASCKKSVLFSIPQHSGELLERLCYYLLGFQIHHSVQNVYSFAILLCLCRGKVFPESPKLVAELL